jgi:predicted Rossmann fold flavoprotein
MASAPNDADVIVVGAGAAGIIAAWRAACLGARVVLLEKTGRIGTKILISGGGKCNITHAGTIAEVLKGFRPNEARFLRSACYRFRNDQIVEMLTDRGLQVTTRADGRIFPVDQSAKDVVRILSSYLEEADVDIRMNCAVSGLEVSDGRAIGVKFEASGQGESTLRAPAIIVCVGGTSYPGTGTTGDGWGWARALGHSVVKVTAALAPMYLDFDAGLTAEMSGIALRDCLLRARQEGKELARWRGDLLFTHHGVSGPAALGISRDVAERMRVGSVTLDVDLAPDGSFEAVAAETLAYTTQHPKRLVATFIDGFVPGRLVDSLLDAASVPRDQPCARLDKKSRNRLVAVLKGWALGNVRAVPLEKGEVTAGGVSLDEVDSQTMESALVGGLYFCGEVLDIAGAVGGYNLQAAFATGFVAGECAANTTFKKS